jgi:hypothetical protein
MKATDLEARIEMRKCPGDLSSLREPPPPESADNPDACRPAVDFSLYL